MNNVKLSCHPVETTVFLWLKVWFTRPKLPHYKTLNWKKLQSRSLFNLCSFFQTGAEAQLAVTATPRSPSHHVLKKRMSLATPLATAVAVGAGSVRGVSTSNRT